MSLIVYRSNRLEALAGELAQSVLRTPLSSPLVREQIVVETQGMAQWLRLDLARRQGVLANVEFPFPRAFIWSLIRTLVPPELQRGAIEPGALAWRIFGKLPELASKPEFLEIRNYIADSPDPRRGFQLAQRVASLFDQYSVYRPKLIEEWIFGKEKGWQPELWRVVMTEGFACQGKFLYELCRALGKGGFDKLLLPERLCLFAPGSLPPSYLTIFEALARHIHVHLFCFTPSREYWGDAVSPWEADKIQSKTGNGELAPEDLHLERINPLLATCGKTGRGFQQLVTDLEAERDVELFQDPGGDTLLHRIQSGILTLEEAPQGEPILVKPADRSIEVHSCHSVLRELQTLRDQLLDWFSTNPELTPEDVLVMLTDVDAYAPFVKGVFEDAEQGAPAIPYTLADLGPRQESSLVDGFISLLQLPAGRLSAVAVMEFLEAPAVRRKFALSDEELDQLRLWIQTSGIRWGRNAQHRESLGLPAFPEHTWEHGCDRLLLGYAMADTQENTFLDLMPCDGIEGTTTELLGRWLEFVQVLFKGIDALSAERTLNEWADTLGALLGSLFLAEPGKERATAAILGALDVLRQEQRASGFAGAVPLSLVLERLLPVLQEPQPGKAFLRGAVTFCGLSPMRGIPFKVVCILGMQDGSFPRNPSPPSFDLMAKRPQTGDESRRDDDRYLFLESLLSAREKFYVSYVGQSVKDNSPRPPSVVVSELLDFVASHFQIAQDSPGNKPEIAKDLLVTTHRLHPFSPTYFRQDESADKRLFGYSPSHARVSRILASQAGKAAVLAPFLEKPLPDPEEPLVQVSLLDLQSFFRNPCRHFVEKRLEFKLPRDRETLEDEEPFAIDSLSSFKFKQQVLDAAFSGRTQDGLLAGWKASGALPPGLPGTMMAKDLHLAAEPVRQRVKEVVRDVKLTAKPFELALGDFTLSGELNYFPGKGVVHYRCASVDRKKKSEAHVKTWIDHLVLQLAGEGEKKSCLMGDNGSWLFEDVPNAESLLRSLVELYVRGMNAPLPFFPRAAFAFVIGPGPRTKRTPAEEAALAWFGREDSEFGTGECEDPYMDLCYGNHPNPLSEEFEEIARQVAGPIVAAEKEGI